MSSRRKTRQRVSMTRGGVRAPGPIFQTMTTIIIDGEHLTLEALALAADGGVTLVLDEAARQRVSASRRAFEALLARGDAVYGANTGFGLLSDVRISADDSVTLQENLIRSHSAGVGEPMSARSARVMM